MKCLIADLRELDSFAKNLLKSMPKGGIIALTGELGAGKTAFVKKFLRNAGIKRNIASPTFTLIVPYKSKNRLFYHMDLYRIKGYKEFNTMGVRENWNTPNTFFLIEWADKIKRILPKNAVQINFKVKGSGRKVAVRNAPKSFRY